MKTFRLIYKATSERMLLVIILILLALWVGPAYSASQPGTVTIVLAEEPGNLDPANTETHDVGGVLTKNIVEPLTEVNATDGVVNPRLATSWRQVDKNTWHFFLRKGVKFHDGSDFNAEAAVFNIKRIYDKRIQPSGVRVKFFTFEMEGKALDNYTLEIKTKTFQPLMPTLMGNLNMCSPNTPLDKLTRQPIGTGPYKFVKWDPGTQIIVERFAGYWGKQPEIAKAIYIWRGESAIRAAMVLVGEADLAPTIAVQDANRPDMDSSYLNSETSLQTIESGEPPLNDRRVRLALNYAVNRVAIRGSILSKDVIPATQIIGPNIFGYNPDLKPWPYDPKKAKQLVDEARKDGVPVDREILLVGRGGMFPGHEELMEATMSMYNAVGLSVKIRIVESGPYQSYLNKPRPKVPFLMQTQIDDSAGDAVFAGVFLRYHSDGRRSFTSDKQLDDLIERAQVATGEERKKLWQAAFKRIHEELVCDVFLFHMVGYTRVGKRINFKPSIATNNEVELAQITFTK